MTHTTSPDQLLLALAQELSCQQNALGLIGEQLETAWRGDDWRGYGQTLRQFIRDVLLKYADADQIPHLRAYAQQAKQILANLVEDTLRPVQQGTSQTTGDIDALMCACQNVSRDHATAPAPPITDTLSEEFIVKIRTISQQMVLRQSLCDCLLQQIGELMDALDWPHEHIEQIRHILFEKLDETRIAQACTTLSEIIHAQGVIKRGIAHSNDSVRHLLGTFVQRIDIMADKMHRYHARFNHYCNDLVRADSKTDIQRVVHHILHETARIQHQARNARDDLITTRQQVEQASAKIVALENQLRRMAEQINEDQLTRALNRRGFNAVFKRELARTLRLQKPLCVAIIDLDDFRKINQTYGHAGGDAALCHFVAVANATLRASDTIARFGGEEFIFLMPETALLEGQSALTRLQLCLQEQCVQHENKRFRVTCSAGIALLRANETQEDLLRRADQALFAAKAAGKNQTIRAD